MNPSGRSRRRARTPSGSFEKIARSRWLAGFCTWTSSAIVKLVVPEPETKAHRELLRSWPERVSSVVARIEVERVARQIGGGAIPRVRTVL